MDEDLTMLIRPATERYWKWAFWSRGRGLGRHEEIGHAAERFEQLAADEFPRLVQSP